jgi:hypothetical protein
MIALTGIKHWYKLEGEIKDKCIGLGVKILYRLGLSFSLLNPLLLV